MSGRPRKERERIVLTIGDCLLIQAALSDHIRVCRDRADGLCMPELRDALENTANSLDRVRGKVRAEVAAHPVAARLLRHSSVLDAPSKIDLLRSCNTELLATLKQLAAECGDCNGAGIVPNDAMDGDEACESCADLRAAIARAEARILALA